MVYSYYYYYYYSQEKNVITNRCSARFDLDTSKTLSYEKPQRGHALTGSTEHVCVCVCVFGLYYYNTPGNIFCCIANTVIRPLPLLLINENRNNIENIPSQTRYYLLDFMTLYT